MRPTTQGGIGLAQLAVHPDFQRRGIGSRLICEGLSACRPPGYGFVVVLGEPASIGDSASIGPTDGASGMNAGQMRTSWSWS